jgi:MoxR-like ATPase
MMLHASPGSNALPEDDVIAVQHCERVYNLLRDELAKVIVGQHDVVEQALVAVFARGHALLEGVPGLAKSLLVGSLAQAMGLRFKRIQFTPDLMPSDVTGSDVIYEHPHTGTREYRFLPGPLFANLILADEINRTPPKTQAAMLEAMQERQVSVGGTTHALPDPFFVIATQNPLEQEGTYPLPEAQLDRFLLHIRVGYPSAGDEWEIARRATIRPLASVEPTVTPQQVLGIQSLVERVPVCDQVLGYACALVRASRPGAPEAPEFVNRWVRWGAGPRGVLSLLWAAKARAVLYGRFHAAVADVQSLAHAALRHRIAGNYAAQAEGIGSDQIIDMLLAEIPPDRPYERPAA